jgi:hypothetical protein
MTMARRRDAAAATLSAFLDTTEKQISDIPAPAS